MPNSRSSSSNLATGERKFSINDWTIEPDACQLDREGESIRLEPRVMDVLVYLADHQGQVVTRDDLLTTLWPDVVVTDSAVNRCVSELRRVFDDDPRAPRVIETISKRGYRLVAPVKLISTPRESATPAAPAYGHFRRITNPGWLLLGFGGLLAILIVVGLALRGPSPPAVLSTRPLTSLPGIERDAALSPEATQVAFSWRHPNAESFDLYVQDVDTAEPVVLSATPKHERFPTWSPDGRWVAFARFDAESCGIYLVSALGTSERKLATCTSVSGLSWSSDGDWIAYGNYDEELATSRIMILSTETLDQRPLTTPAANSRGDFFPAFAPDASSVAFVRGEAGYGTSRVYRISLDSSNSHSITPLLGQVYGMTWDTTGDHLILSAEHESSLALWDLRIADGELTRVPVTSAADFRFPFKSGATMVAETWRYDTDILSATATTVFPLDVLASTHADAQPALSPEGDRLAFVSDRTGAATLWLADVGGNRTPLLNSANLPADARIAAPSWSPDGEWLVFEVHTIADKDIYGMPSAGGAPRRLSQHAAPDVSPSISRDGRTLYFGSNRSGSWQIWALPFPDGGTPVQVTTDGGYLALENASGTTLYVARYGKPDLWECSLPACATTSRALPLHVTDWGNWTTTQQGVLSVERSGTTTRLLLWDEEDSTSSDFGTLPGLVRGQPGLTASRDQREILFTTVNDVQIDLMLINEKPR